MLENEAAPTPSVETRSRIPREEDNLWTQSIDYLEVKRMNAVLT